MCEGNALIPNSRNSISCTVRTSRQRLCDQRVGCMQYDYEGCRALGPATRSGPRLLSMLMTRINSISILPAPKKLKLFLQHNIPLLYSFSQHNVNISIIIFFLQKKLFFESETAL